MARAIVTFGRSWQALAITRSLGRAGVEVFCGEESGFAPCFFSRYCKGSFTYPSVSKEPQAFLDFMEAKIKELAPADGEPYVLMPVHKETWLFAKHRERFEPHIRVPLTDYDKMALVHDKGRLPDLANELGIRIPQTHRFESLEQMEAEAVKLNYPRFLKVREGAAGVGLRKVESPTQLIASYHEFVNEFELEPRDYPLVQEFVPGQDYCVSALFNRGQCVAKMTYRNVRSFPRTTGAGALREAVPFEEAEAEAVRLLQHLEWHGMAELDFRKAEDGPPYLIEVNPRFFGGLSQAIAANVDYPELLYRITVGETVDSPEVDYTARTEAPITGLLATLDEIANDEKQLEKLRSVRREMGRIAYGDLREVSLRPLFDALRGATDTKDTRAFLRSMFEKHQGAVNDVLQKDDPMPALGFMYPVALLLKHGKLTVSLLTGEEDVPEQLPRRGLRSMLKQPSWRVLWVTALLFTASTFFMHWEYSRDSVGWVVALPGRSIQALVGPFDPSTLSGALKNTVSYMLNLMFWYVAAALLLRQPRTLHPDR